MLPERGAGRQEGTPRRRPHFLEGLISTTLGPASGSQWPFLPPEETLPARWGNGAGGWITDLPERCLRARFGNNPVRRMDELLP